MSRKPFKLRPGRRGSDRRARPGRSMSGAKVLSVATGRAASASARADAIASAVVREPAAAAARRGADAVGAAAVTEVSSRDWCSSRDWSAHRLSWLSGLTRATSIRCFGNGGNRRKRLLFTVLDQGDRAQAPSEAPGRSKRLPRG